MKNSDKLKYINNENLPNEVNCNYSHSHKLSAIAEMINTLSSHRVPIVVNDVNFSRSYCGEFTDLQLPFLGIEQGIQTVFKKIKSYEA